MIDFQFRNLDLLSKFIPKICSNVFKFKELLRSGLNLKKRRRSLSSTGEKAKLRKTNRKQKYDDEHEKICYTGEFEKVTIVPSHLCEGGGKYFKYDNSSIFI